MSHKKTRNKNAPISQSSYMWVYRFIGIHLWHTNWFSNKPKDTTTKQKNHIHEKGGVACFVLHIYLVQLNRVYLSYPPAIRAEFETVMFFDTPEQNRSESIPTINMTGNGTLSFDIYLCCYQWDKGPVMNVYVYAGTDMLNCQTINAMRCHLIEFSFSIYKHAPLTALVSSHRIGISMKLPYEIVFALIRVQCTLHWSMSARFCLLKHWVYVCACACIVVNVHLAPSFFSQCASLFLSFVYNPFLWASAKIEANDFQLYNQTTDWLRHIMNVYKF